MLMLMNVEVPFGIGDTIYDISEYVHDCEEPKMYQKVVQEILILIDTANQISYRFRSNSELWEFALITDFGISLFVDEKSALSALKSIQEKSA